MKPKWSWAAGELRRAPNGKTLPGRRSENYCSFDVGDGDDGELARCLRRALLSFSIKRRFIKSLGASGGTVMIYVFWYPNGDTGEVFDADLLADLAELGIELGLNVYDHRPEPDV